jgi:hypothetical protein
LNRIAATNGSFRKEIAMSVQNISSGTQNLSTVYVNEIFRNLESGDGKGFFEHVSDDVDWIVEGTRFCPKVRNCMWNMRS